MRLTGHGLTADLPDGWEGAINVARTDGVLSAAQVAGRLTAAAVEPAVEARPTLHLGNFALPADRGDFGSGAVELMAGDDVFVALVEYGPDCVGTALFEQRGLPRRLDPGRFSTAALQRTLRGQSGQQVFFTEAGRAFCLYVVIGDATRPGELSSEAARALDGLSIERA